MPNVQGGSQLVRQGIYTARRQRYFYLSSNGNPHDGNATHSSRIKREMMDSQQYDGGTIRVLSCLSALDANTRYTPCRKTKFETVVARNHASPPNGRAWPSWDKSP